MFQRLPDLTFKLLFLSFALCLAGCAAPVAVKLKREQVIPPSELLARALNKDSGSLSNDPEAAARFASQWHAEGMPATFDGWKIRVRKGKFFWDPGYFDRLVLASDLTYRGLKNSHTSPGEGSPMVGWRDNTGRLPEEVNYPPEGISRPVTVVMDLKSRASKEITLEFWKTAKTNRRNGKPLATDFSAPWAMLISETSGLRQIGLGGMLRSGRVSRQSRIYLMEPYDPNKGIILMVHGLMSTPLAWLDLTNDLRADDEIRRNYQIWHFHYPTGMPFLYSAKQLRNQLREVRHFLDPEQEDPAMKNTVVLAHSMGGLISKTLITDSEDQVWEVAFNKGPEGLKGDPEKLKTIESIFFWKPQPHVSRVVFIAVPHGGSQMASTFVGRFGDVLTLLPKSFVDLYRSFDRANPGVLRDTMRPTLVRGWLTSIDTLSPSHPVLPVLNRLPIAKGVETHSIIGWKNPSIPKEKSTDGVVPYTSSHFPAAVSEVTVTSGHDAFRHPHATEEILRILRLPEPKD